MNDGILLDGKTLWVVENFANQLVRIRLAPQLSSGRITAVVTDAEVGDRFRVPTTVAEHGHRLALVNGRFDQGLPPRGKCAPRHRLRRGAGRQALKIPDAEAGHGAVLH